MAGAADRRSVGLATSSRPRRAGAIAWLALAAWLAPAAEGLAAEATPAAPASARVLTAASDGALLRARQQALARANAAVIGIEVLALEDARSVATLGRARQGSGVLIGADGLVLTIGYLVLEADHVVLALPDERRVPARVVAYDLATGFGLLQALAPLGLQPAPLGASASVASDEPLMIASGGDDGDLSLARLVSRRPFSGYWEYHIEDALFTAPVRTDHSGAGLFNADGELVGIGSLVVADAGGAEPANVRGNMFVPIDLLKPILGELRTRGASQQSTRPWLGLNCAEVGGQVRVLRLTPGSPAEAAGLEQGDAIVAVDGVPVGALEAFYKTLWRAGSAERDIALDIKRGDRALTLNVHAVDRMKTLSRPQAT